MQPCDPPSVPHTSRRRFEGGPHVPLVAALACLVGTAGCGDSRGSGDLLVLVEPDAVTSEGLEAGLGPEQVVDGWDVTFDQVLVSVGEVELGRSLDDALHETSPVVLVVDTTELLVGYELDRFEGIASVRWDRFSFRTLPPTSAATRHASVTSTDFDAMVAGGLTHVIEGHIDQVGGESCPPGGSCRATDRVDFRFEVSAPTLQSYCAALDAPVAGVAVPSGGTAVAGVSFHGDHLFFTVFPHAGHGVIERRGQWLANADVNGDDFVDMDELTSITDLAYLFPPATYNASGALVSPFDSADDWVVSHLGSVGHFDGEGECTYMLEL